MKKVIPKDSVLVPDGAERAFKGMIFDVYQWPQKLFDGSEHRFEMLKRPDTVNAICVVDGKILVLDDEQPHLGSRQSFPGGRIDDPSDTSVESAAKREILEETGYSFKNWRLIKVTQPYRKVEWFVYLMLAWDVASKQEPVLDPGEKIDVKHTGFDELKALVFEESRRGKGYLGESLDVFDSLNSLDDLLALPEYSGQEVDR